MRSRSFRSIAFDSLEVRDLKSDIPGVSMLNGVVTIQATQVSGNVAQVDRIEGGLVRVSFNGQVEDFADSDLSAVDYLGGNLGGDSFTNNTDLTDVVNAYGGNNTITSGSGTDIEFLEGDGNTVNENGSFSVIFTRGGADTINGSPTLVF